MVKITLIIEGMACGICEAHINHAIRRNFPVKRVSSSHTKGITEVITKSSLNREKLKKSNRGNRISVAG